MAPIVELADDRAASSRCGSASGGRGSDASRLYLIDTKIEGNPTWARDVTDSLYGGDRENRLRQELVLGVGGVRVLRRLGLEPSVFHMNEGHSAFLQLERHARARRGAGPLGGRGARAAARVDRLHDPHAGARRKRGVRPRARAPQPRRARRALRPRLGRLRRARQGRPERHALRVDAVRAAHVEVRERRLRAARCRLARDVARPVARARASTRCRSRRSRTASTSGRGSRPSSRCCSATRTRSSSWRESCRPKTCGSHTAAAKQRLLSFVTETRGARELDPDVLTIGFARRFATYKRASLLFSDPDAARAAPRRLRAADPGARRGQGASGRRGREGRDPARGRLRARARGGRARRLPRGLRDDARAAARAGRRRLAQHAAAAARGVAARPG